MNESEQLYYILSLKWSKGRMEYVWWRPDDSGYTTDLNAAGIYTQEKIDRKPLYYRNQNTYAVPKETVALLYVSRVVPTLDDSWMKLNINVESLPHY